jgi:hypothetical protein
VSSCSRLTFPPIVVALVVALVAATLGAPTRAGAHEIPIDVVIQAWLKPEDERLNLLVRVPLEAMRDLTFPTTGPGYLDLAASELMLEDAAQSWIANGIELYEGEERLEQKRVVDARVSLPADTSVIVHHFEKNLYSFAMHQV